MIWLALFLNVIAVFFSFRSLRARRGDALGVPLVAIGSFAFLYIVQPASLLLSSQMPPSFTKFQIVGAIVLPAPMLACFMRGWLYRSARHSSRRLWNGQTLWRFGVLTAAVGLLFEVLFLSRSGGIHQALSAAHGGALAYEGNTAYLYNAPRWMLTGTAMMIIGASRFRASLLARRLPYMFAAISFSLAVLTAGRGPLFSTCAVVMISRGLVAKKPVMLWTTVGALLAIGVGVVLMVGYRSVLHLGAPNIETPRLADALRSLTDTGRVGFVNKTYGNEFVYHTAIISTVGATKKISFGLEWVYYLVINPIPRLWWPGKSYPQSQGITFTDIKDSTGIDIAVGSAPGLVADLYRHLWFGAFPFLYACGRFARRLHCAAIAGASPVAMCSYVMLYAATLNGFTQELIAMFVSVGYSMLPIMCFALLSKKIRVHLKRAYSACDSVPAKF